MPTTPAGTPAASFQLADEEVLRFLQANAVFGRTERFRTLDRLEAHFRCRQYDHQTLDWWGKPAEFYEVASPESTVPPGFQQTGGGGPAVDPDDLTVRERRPTAPENLGRTIPKRFTGLLFSEARKPEVIVDGDPDTQAMLEAVREDSGFWQTMRAARDKGGAMGSTCVTVHVRDQRFSYEVHNTKHLTVVWKNRRTWTPLAVLKSWTYLVEEEVRNEKTGRLEGTKQVEYLVRRAITEQVDVTYKPVRLEPGAESSDLLWDPDPQNSTTHGLGFFPGVWVQNAADPDEMDGDADCEGAFPTLDTIDRLIAQMNKGVLLNLDPTVEAGWDEKEVGASPDGSVRKGSGNLLNVGKSGHAKYMEMAGTGIDAGHRLLDRLEKNVHNITGYVPVDPDKISGAAQSAKAIEYVFAPMIERADDLRGQYGPAVVALQRMTELIIRRFSTAEVDLGGGRVGRFLPFDLPPRTVEGPGGEKQSVPHRLGPGGYYKLKWGPYFAPTLLDDKQKIDNSTAANAAGLVDRVTAARAVAPIFGVGDVEGTVARARAELEEDAARAMAGVGGGVPPGPDHDEDARGPAAGAGGRA